MPLDHALILHISLNTLPTRVHPKMSASKDKHTKRVEIWRWEVAEVSDTVDSTPSLSEKTVMGSLSDASSGKHTKGLWNRLLGIGTKSREMETGLKTRMYDFDEAFDATAKPKEGEDGDESLEAEMESSDGKGKGVLEERRERLERAARLLNSGRH